MSKRFAEYKSLDMSAINVDVLAKWQRENTAEESMKPRDGQPAYVFFDGPPSANGRPGIHHVMARAIKDCFCRYKTLQGFYVKRKAGWDTHGLPVELGVEKRLGITKEDIGKKISVDDYNAACRSDVMKYIGEWGQLTDLMGFWIDMKDPYITYDNRYIESLWNLLQILYNKGLLYKGYTIQPYSPAAGTGLSTHELNQPGCYRDVKDTTLTAQFKVIEDEKAAFIKADIIKSGCDAPLYILAWTTTPWTLPSNTALCVGEKINYVLVSTFNPYTAERVCVVLAKDRLSAYFAPEGKDAPMEFKAGDKKLPYKILAEYTGKELLGIRYEQLMPMVKVQGKAFEVISGDYVTTSDGTGIVHIAPTFGADDMRVAKNFGIAPLLVKDADGREAPMVDKKGRFFPVESLDPQFVAAQLNMSEYSEFAGRYVKNAYDDALTDKDATLDIDISVKLKKENKAFKVEKHTHSYPHCWRTDKPVLYYPLDSWFIRTTALRERLIELNNTIRWKPASTGSGRFGNWLENLQDWNLSRSRYWGTPLPIWRTADGKEEVCIGSMEELMAGIEKAVAAGVMKENPYAKFKVGDYSAVNYAPENIDLHRPYIDGVVLVSPSGQPMYREPDLIDVWFDSGAMPFAQYHYPFEHKDDLPFPADFIAEGVDQTRGWFFTLHAIATMTHDSVAFKNVISNGLVLDKNGNKMSKRLGNAVDPFEAIGKYGADAVRWYMITNSQPWDNLKFDEAGVDEVRRKFFGTLYNTYSFFALYANIDGFTGEEPQVPVAERPEIDRWIISLLNTLCAEVTDAYENYEPTRAGRAVQEFVLESLSNWYVRLNRKRFWGGTMDMDKLAAYQTLYECLVKVAVMASPIAPFFTDRLYTDLCPTPNTVHLAAFPKWDTALIDKPLEQRMQYAQTLCSMVLALRRKVSIKVRQPLNKIMLPILDESFRDQIERVKHLILSELNVKELEYLTDASGVLVKRIKPNFKVLGKKVGKQMKAVAEAVGKMTAADITALEKAGEFALTLPDGQVALTLEDVEIQSEDIPGWLVATEGALTVALDITVTPELQAEGIAREFVNRIQNLRKESGLDVTDRIAIFVGSDPQTDAAVQTHGAYIAQQTLATEVRVCEAGATELALPNATDAEILDGVNVRVTIKKI